jgi:type IV secretory pathway VirB2 component (pilin)
MTPRLRVHSVPQVRRILQSQRVRPATVVLALFFLMPVAVLAQGSPFDTGFTAIQSLFTGTIAKVASLVAIVIGGYGFAHGEPGANKALAGVAAGTGIAVGSGGCSAFPKYLLSTFRRGTYARQATAEAAHKSSLQEPA